MDQEQAAIGTLQLVAAAAAPIAPWGTAASVVISAGIGIYTAIEEAEKQKSLIKADELKYTAQLEDASVQKKVMERVYKRPTVPLDLYSGPPMYWIVNSSFLDSADKHYQLPNSDKGVEWPCNEIGGKSITENADQENIATEDIYASSPPESCSNPTLCVFFWAVPIFFARIMQLLGDSMYSPGYDPKSQAYGERTKEDVLYDEVKKIILSGRIDQAGNWFGKIGPVIPPLALSDDEYAPRFYGRSGWVQSVAASNIRFSNGTRYANTDLANSKYIQFVKNKENVDKSKILSRINKRVILTLPQSNTTALGTTVMSSKFTASSFRNPILRTASLVLNAISDVTIESGWIVSAKTLLSNFHIEDPDFQAMLESGDPDNSAFYYTTMLEILPTQQLKDDIKRYSDFVLFPYSLMSSRWNLTPSGIMKYIQEAGGYARNLDPTPSMQSVHSTALSKDASLEKSRDTFFRSEFARGFALAPFDLKIAMKWSEVRTKDGVKEFGPRPVPQTKTDSYVFKDVETTVDENTVGIYDGKGDIKNRYGWITQLAMMPGYDASNGLAGWKAVEASKKYNAHSSDQTKELKLQSWKLYTSKVYTFLPSLVLKKGAKIENQTSLANALPAISEIIRSRPPRSGEKTVSLPAKYATGPSWANKLIKSGASRVDFAVRPASQPDGFRLGLIRVQKFTHSVDVHGKEKSYPQLSENSVAIATFSHEENKPIFCVEGKENISPFYCGRRADERSKPAWKHARDQTSNLGSPTNSSKDTGWEDCHDWSWPYPTSVLKQIGITSKELFEELGEGIGRSGCSPSSIATGPTFWGDMNLYGMSYQSLKYGLSTTPGSNGWKNNVAICIWDALSEMQVGAYTRYPSRSNNISQSLAKAVESKFNIYSNSKLTRNSYLEKAKATQESGQPLRVWDEKNNKWVNLTPDQAADLCMDVVDTWFNGTFPRPTKDYENKFAKTNWSHDTLKDMARAHIKLKNWALDLGKSEPNRTGYEFPSDSFSINVFGLNKANRDAIASYEAVRSEQIYSENPMAIINDILLGDSSSKGDLNSSKKESTLFSKKNMVIAAATTAAIIATAAAVSHSRKS
jgi:hypothetical protein